MKREFTMLAHTYCYGMNVRNWYASRKYDGFSIMWDGGITRGLPAEQVPWYKKGGDDRYKHRVISTGLWSRRGKVVLAPDWWLDKLPQGAPLQGELWSNDDRRMAAVGNTKNVLDPRWHSIQFVYYNYKPYSLWGNVEQFYKPTPFQDSFNQLFTVNRPFIDRLQTISTIHEICEIEDIGFLAEQKMIRNETELHAFYNEAVFNRGWEGIMLMNGNAPYEDYRSHNLLKAKICYDIEAEVCGYVNGQNRHKGRLGSLTVKVKWDEKVLTFRGGKEEHVGKTVLFHVGSGLTDLQRDWDYVLEHFSVGKVVTVNFNEVGANGAPPAASLG